MALIGLGAMMYELIYYCNTYTTCNTMKHRLEAFRRALAI